MLKFLTLSLLVVLFAGCEANSDVEIGNKTTMKIDRLFDAGEVMRGEVITAKFKVTNTGDYPLVFGDIKPSCSCTLSSSPDKPILPGETDYITATVNTDRVGVGSLTKTISVTANTSPRVTQLKIKGVVMSK